MPKIIKDLKPQILETAQTMIDGDGYEQLSMRNLAKEVGIAVGTLYNYFPNKDDLLIHVLEESWRKTLQRLDHICRVSLNPTEDFITVLYDDIAARKGLGRTLMVADPNSGVVQDVFRIFQHLADDLQKIFESASYRHPEKKATMIMVSLGHMIQRFPEDRSGNIAFLLDIARS